MRLSVGLLSEKRGRIETKGTNNMLVDMPAPFLMASAASDDASSIG